MQWNRLPASPQVSSTVAIVHRSAHGFAHGAEGQGALIHDGQIGCWSAHRLAALAPTHILRYESHPTLGRCVDPGAVFPCLLCRKGLMPDQLTMARIVDCPGLRYSARVGVWSKVDPAVDFPAGLLARAVRLCSHPNGSKLQKFRAFRLIVFHALADLRVAHGGESLALQHQKPLPHQTVGRLVGWRLQVADYPSVLAPSTPALPQKFHSVRLKSGSRQYLDVNHSTPRFPHPDCR